MLEIVQEYNLHEKLANQVRDLVQTLKLNCHNYDQIRFRIVGIERNWNILFTWILENNTYIAVFNRHSRKSELLFTHKKVITITNTSVNAFGKLLAFSCYDTIEKNYSSFVSEIRPQKCLFSLNVKWKTFQKVLFLKQLSESDTSSRLLFFHHMESISLYHMPYSLPDNTAGVVINLHPSSIHVARRHVWAQFDADRQRLYYVVLHPSEETGSEASGYFNVVEFNAKGEHEYVLNFILPFTFRMESMQQEDVSYDDSVQFSETVCCSGFNLRVLEGEHNSLYVCHQHSSGLHDSEGSVASSKESFFEDPCVHYSICCVHSGYTVHCSTAGAGDRTILFLLLDNLLIAYAHDTLLHVLDIGSEHEPIANILLPNDNPMFPHSNCLLMNTFGNSVIFDQNFTSVFTFQWDNFKIYRLFCYSDAATRLAIVHVLIVHLNDRKLIKKVFKRALNDYADLEVPVLLKEYFLAQNYQVVKKYDSSKFDLKLFPFTTLEFYRGQIARNSRGERNTHLFYKRFSDDLTAHIKKNLYKNNDEFWSCVFRCLTYDSQYNKRFPVKLWFLAGCEEPKATRSKSFIETSISSLASSSSSVYQHNDNNDTKGTVATRILSRYIIQNHRNISKPNTHKLCHVYTAERRTLVDYFVKVLTKIVSVKSLDAVLDEPLTQEVDENVRILFHVIERLKGVIDELCFPEFLNMGTVFCTLGFRVLTHFQFIQYLRACMFDVDAKFVERVFRELNDSNENVELKSTLLEYLPDEQVRLEILKNWNHVDAKRHMVRQAFASLPCHRVLEEAQNFQEFQESATEFAPLCTLVESARKQKADGNFNIEDSLLDMISKTSLMETEHLIS